MTMAKQTTTTHIPSGFKLLRTLAAHDKVITRLSWSPDGKRFASAGKDGVIQIWDTETGKLLKRLSLPGTIKLGPYWLTSEFESAIAWTPAWSKDGRIIECGYGDATIRLWNAHTGEIIRTLEGHTAKVNNVAWSPDGRLLASSADDDIIKIWNAETGTLIADMRGHRAGINNIAWHPTDAVLASGSLDGTIRIWDTRTYKALKTLSGHEEMVITVVWSPRRPNPRVKLRRRDHSTLECGFRIANESPRRPPRVGELYRLFTGWSFARIQRHLP
jgi:WD40 repeat protein